LTQGSQADTGRTATANNVLNAVSHTVKKIMELYTRFHTDESLWLSCKIPTVRAEPEQLLVGPRLSPHYAK